MCINMLCECTNLQQHFWDIDTNNSKTEERTTRKETSLESHIQEATLRFWLQIPGYAILLLPKER